jgi:hypothetical protein
MVEWLERLFPRLIGTPYRITSPATDVYNCLAWAARVTNGWWWPVGDPGTVHWPPGVARQETLEALRDAFATLGYAPCDTEEPEAGFEKVALFADAQGLPTHAARQLFAGCWTSKLGRGEDIEHDPRALEGEAYGTVALVVKRPLGETASAPSDHPEGAAETPNETRTQ